MPSTPTYRPVYKALHKPLQWFQMDYRICWLGHMVVVLGFAYSWLLVCAALWVYGAGRWLAKREDPQYLQLKLWMPRSANRYDPGRASPVRVRLT